MLQYIAAREMIDGGGAGLVARTSSGWGHRLGCAVLSVGKENKKRPGGWELRRARSHMYKYTSYFQRRVAQHFFLGERTGRYIQPKPKNSRCAVEGPVSYYRKLLPIIGVATGTGRTYLIRYLFGGLATQDPGSRIEERWRDAPAGGHAAAAEMSSQKLRQATILNLYCFACE